MRARHIRLVIGGVQITGLSSFDARRLIDRLEIELAALAPQLATLARSEARQHVDAGILRAERRIERTAAPLARAVIKAMLP